QLWSRGPAALALAVLISIVFGGSAMAQITGSGSISGTLTDPNGGVVPSAALMIKNTDTGAEREAGTNEVGLYTVPFLQPGQYEVSAMKSGFAKVVRSGLTLQVGQNLTIDLSLPVQQTSETITVNSDADVVDTSKTEVSQMVSQVSKEN